MDKNIMMPICKTNGLFYIGLRDELLFLVTSNRKHV
jgi:hypothetical protein